MNLISNIYTFSLLSVLSAFLTLQYNMYLKNDMIFQSFRKNVLNRLPLFIAKPLGLCIYCNGFWISIILYLVFYIKHIFILDIDIILFSSINYIVLNTWLKIETFIK